MAVIRCLYCDKHVQFLQTKFGNRLLFDAIPVPVDDAGTAFGWMPGQWRVANRERTVLAPVGHYSREKRSRVRHVVTLHHCPPYQSALAAAGMNTRE